MSALMNDIDSPVAAREPDADGAPRAAQDNQFVSFCVAGEMFAVPMAPVQEIIRVPDVARLPLAPACLDGLANLRGRVLPIVNLRRLFGIDEREHDDATRALVIHLGQSLGFVVDRVASVLSIEPGEIERTEGIQSIVQADYLTGVIKRAQADGTPQLLLVLDFERLVADRFAHVAQPLPGASDAAAGGPQAQSSGSAADAASASDELRVVSFTVAGQEYGIDIADVQEIVQVPETITALPNTPSQVLGVISLRQRLLPLVSLRTMFGLPALELDEHHRIVVVALPGRGLVGLVTDAVKEVLSVPRSEAEPMPGILARDDRLQEFASILRLDGGKRLVSILSTERLLGAEAVRAAAQAVERAAGDDAHGEDEMTGDAAQRAGADEDDAQVVIFRLGAEEFGVPIMSVQEIVRVPDTLTRVPRTPAFVEGVINLRGTVLPVIDQRSRLGLPAIERNDRQRIMVYTLAGLRTGFIVDSVAEVLRIPRQRIERAPALSEEQSRLIDRVAKLDGDRRMVMLIDPRQLLGTREIGAMEGLIGGQSEAAGPGAPLARAA